MATKTSVKSAARAAKQEETRARAALTSITKDQAQTIRGVSADSFVNFAHKLGMGADNALTSSRYGFNPISRDRLLLEWIHRGSWLGGIAVDTVADDMTRAGIEYITEIPPDQSEILDRTMTSLNTWFTINDVIRWGRLYGGAIGVVMIDGQDFRTPLRLDTVGRGQYKGLMVLDRWMVEPSLEDLVTDLGPHLGLPKYYRVTQAAPALRGVAVHHSRVAIRHVGIDLPYQQSLTENMWGISVIERMYDRMIAFDSASTGAAQLVHKSYIRTMSVDGLRDVIAAGGKPLDGMTAYVDMMRRFQGIEGITMIDMKDKFEAQSHSSFSGLSDALTQLGQQLSGALQIPLVRLFGQSPGGLGSNGESEMRQYYDHIKQQQMKTLHQGVTLIYKLGARSAGIPLPPNFSIGFKSLWELSDNDKVNLAKTVVDTVSSAHEQGLVSQKVALQELRQASRVSGVFTNITKEMIDQADDTVQPPGGQDLLGSLIGGGDSGAGGGGVAPTHDLPGGQDDGGLNNGTPGSQGQETGMDASPRSRKPLQLPAPRRR